MRTSPSLLAASALALTLLVPSEAGAGTTAPLSSLAALPRPTALKAPSVPTPIPGLTLKTKDGYGSTQYHELFASTGRGYCLAQKENGYRWMGSYGSGARSASEDLDLDRLTEKDGTVTLERTRVHFDPPSGTITATGRSQVELKEIAHTPAGVVVWAYREDGAIVILAKSVERGVESRRLSTEETSVPFVSADGCPFAGARVDARKPEAGAFAQLTGSLPAQGTGKDKVVPHFVVDVSLTRVARDPEPFLGVRVRLKD
jgi:hypothetical protein